MPCKQEFILLEQALYTVWLGTTDGADSTRDSYALLHAQRPLLNSKVCLRTTPGLCGCAMLRQG